MNLTQSCTAANDNILNQILIFGLAAGGIWVNQLGDGAQAVGSLCLAVPFLPFSRFAGQFSDRYSKRNVTVVVKLFGVVMALVATVGFWLLSDCVPAFPRSAPMASDEKRGAE